MGRRAQHIRGGRSTGGIRINANQSIYRNPKDVPIRKKPKKPTPRVVYPCMKCGEALPTGNEAEHYRMFHPEIYREMSKR